jgi:Family of unknown function (DUF6186)
MSSRTVTFFGFGLIVTAAVVWSIVAARSPTLITLPRLLARVTRSRVVRFLLVVGWAWLGWHLFARGSGAFE